MAADLPCDGDGVCMVCKTKPSDNDKLTCNTCVTPWHAACLSNPIQSLADVVNWTCPDCTMISAPAAVGDGSDLMAKIREIKRDEKLSDQEKAIKRQKLLGGSGDVAKEKGSGVMDLFDEAMNCSFCLQLPERPVTV